LILELSIDEVKLLYDYCIPFVQGVKMGYRASTCLASAILLLAPSLHAQPVSGSGSEQRIFVDSFSAVASISDACPTGEAGTRRQNFPFAFHPAFKSVPSVTVGLNRLDAGDGRNVRINAYAINVTKDGATVVVETWCDTHLFSAAGSIIAVGDK
jgi:hypothetical protein